MALSKCLHNSNKYSQKHLKMGAKGVLKLQMDIWMGCKYILMVRTMDTRDLIHKPTIQYIKHIYFPLQTQDIDVEVVVGQPWFSQPAKTAKSNSRVRGGGLGRSVMMMMMGNIKNEMDVVWKR